MNILFSKMFSYKVLHDFCFDLFFCILSYKPCFDSLSHLNQIQFSNSNLEKCIINGYYVNIYLN